MFTHSAANRVWFRHGRIANPSYEGVYATLGPMLMKERDVVDALRYIIAKNRRFAPHAGIVDGANTFQQCVDIERR